MTLFSTITFSERFVLEDAFCKPSSTHWFGCDTFGRDLFMMITKGTIYSLGTTAVISIFLTFTALIIGAVLAVRKSRIITQVNDFFIVFPTILIALILAAFLKSTGFNLFFALFFGYLPTQIRVYQALSANILAKDFCEASRSLGKGNIEIIRTDILPFTIEYGLVKLPGLIGNLILLETTLTFLGLGGSVGHVNLGGLLSQARDYFFEFPHLTLFTGLPLFMVVAFFQALSERLLNRFRLGTISSS